MREIGYIWCSACHGPALSKGSSPFLKGFFQCGCCHDQIGERDAMPMVFCFVVAVFCALLYPIDTALVYLL